jgi:hypothetical protein
MSKTLLVAIFLSLSLAGCKTTYKKDGFMGGFTDTRMSENVWRINVRGNGLTSEERVSDIVILRAADLATQNGFSHFAFVSEAKGEDTVTTYTPGQSSTYGTVTANPMSNTATYYGTTTTSGGYFSTIKKPKAESVVVMFKEEPKNARGIVYSAKFVCESIGAKLEATCGTVR